MTLCRSLFLLVLLSACGGSEDPGSCEQGSPTVGAGSYLDPCDSNSDCCGGYVCNKEDHVCVY